VALGLAVATKQYMVLALPLAWRLGHTPRESRRAVAVAAAAAAAASLPALADPQGVFHSVVMVQLREALRMDSLSLAVWLARVGVPLSTAAYVAIVAVALGAAAWRAPSTPAGVFGALAVTLLTTFAFGKKAFCNYYLLVIAVLAIAVAVRRDEPTTRPPAA
jgi:hypothetical protein